MFQSSPPEFGGRIAICALGVQIAHSFNPRPPSSGGASATRILLAHAQRVSILAPRVRGAHRC